jgi:predicted HAD superfamily Cof-like phosphohydrolase
VDPDSREMACALVEEEAAELRAAVEASDLVEIADAVADLLWVVIEAGLTYGIPIEEVFEEVRRSNLTKVDMAEPARNARGKIVAGEGFSPPDLLPILAAHARSPQDAEEWARPRRSTATETT